MNGRKRFSPIIRLGLVVWGIGFTAGAPVSGYFLVRMLLHARANTNWSAVPGTVTSAAVVRSYSPLNPKYHTEVAYDYTVAGVDYKGGRIRTNDGDWDSFDSARRALGQLATGAQVMVHYDPADPSQSLLEPGAGYQEIAVLIAPVMMLAAGVLLWWLLLRDIFGRKTPPPLPAPVRGGNFGIRN
ncbi:MAG: hypothetical protein JWN51_3559 [Phycisphaerales bacterium]|nr:hypothetical protein [Phycisphaerales bacterium]